MPVDKHHNTLYSGGIPTAIGDRQYAQDKFRDFDHLRDRIGRAATDRTGEHLPVIIEGGRMSRGTGDTINITPVVGYVPGHPVVIPDNISTPPGTTLNETLPAIRVETTQQNNLAIPSAVLDGSTVNYVKVDYVEVNGPTRTRAKTGGSYAYERVASFTITVDTTPPTANQLYLGYIVGLAGDIAWRIRNRAGSTDLPGTTVNMVAGSNIDSTPALVGMDFAGRAVENNGGQARFVALSSNTAAQDIVSLVARETQYVANSGHDVIWMSNPTPNTARYVLSYERQLTVVEAVAFDMDLRDGSVVSIGTPVTVGSGAGGPSRMCALSSTSFAIIHANGTTQTRMSAGTLAGQVITMGSDVVVRSAVWSEPGWICAFSDGVSGAAFASGPTNDYEVTAFTVSGTVVTLGTPVAVSSDALALTACWGGLGPAGEARTFLCVYAGPTNVRARMGTVAGTTVTLSTEFPSVMTTPNRARGTGVTMNGNDLFGFNDFICFADIDSASGLAEPSMRCEAEIFGNISTFGSPAISGVSGAGSLIGLNEMTSPRSKPFTLDSWVHDNYSGWWCDLFAYNATSIASLGAVKDPSTTVPIYAPSKTSFSAGFLNPDGDFAMACVPPQKWPIPGSEDEYHGAPVLVTAHNGTVTNGTIRALLVTPLAVETIGVVEGGHLKGDELTVVTAGAGPKIGGKSTPLGTGNTKNDFATQHRGGFGSIIGVNSNVLIGFSGGRDQRIHIRINQGWDVLLETGWIYRTNWAGVRLGPVALPINSNGTFVLGAASGSTFYGRYHARLFIAEPGVALSEGVRQEFEITGSVAINPSATETALGVLMHWSSGGDSLELTTGADGVPYLTRTTGTYNLLGAASPAFYKIVVYGFGLRHHLGGG